MKHALFFVIQMGNDKLCWIEFSSLILLFERENNATPGAQQRLPVDDVLYLALFKFRCYKVVCICS